jgi:hypothetical protein
VRWLPPQRRGTMHGRDLAYHIATHPWSLDMTVASGNKVQRPASAARSLVPMLFLRGSDAGGTRHTLHSLMGGGLPHSGGGRLAMDRFQRNLHANCAACSSSPR